MDLKLLPEDRLCLLMAQASMTEVARREVLELLSLPLEWERFLVRSQEHGVFPLIYKHMTALGSARIPEPVFAELTALFRKNALRNALLSKELEKILTALAGAGIQTVPLKGLPLAVGLYGSADLRVCSDIDILIPRTKLTDAVTLLESQGYVPGFYRSFLSEQTIRNSYEFPMQKNAGKFVYLVELHIGLIWESNVEDGCTPDFWLSAVPGKYGSASTFLPSPEWEVLFLCVHAARHDWQCLKWLVDIDTYIRQGNVDWSAVEAKAESFGWQRVLRQSLDICAALFHTSLPELRTPAAPINSERYFPAPPQTPTPLQNTMLSISFEKTWSASVRLLLRRILVPTPREGGLVDLPARLRFLYYLLRPLRLAYKSVSNLVSRCMKSSR